ncbi:hypothetical protein C5167_044800, partial [Papaver somniferum]
IVKRNNTFLVKEFGNGNQMVQFSKEPNNLYNVNSFKHSVKLEKIEGVVLATTNPNKQKNPSSLVDKTVMKKKISRTAKDVAKLPHLSNLAYKQVALPDVEVGSYVLVIVGEAAEIERRAEIIIRYYYCLGMESHGSLQPLSRNAKIPCIGWWREREVACMLADDCSRRVMIEIGGDGDIPYPTCIFSGVLNCLSKFYPWDSKRVLIAVSFRELGMLRLLISHAMGFETIPRFTLLLGLEAGLDFDCQLHPMLPVII